MWGGTHTDQAGRSLENAINYNNLVVMNTGEGTYLNSRSNSWSPIDLTFVSPALGPRLDWKVLQNYMYSNHAPTSIMFRNSQGNHSLPRRWLLKKANWEEYQRRVILPMPSDNMHPDIIVTQITTAILRAAEASVHSPQVPPELKLCRGGTEGWPRLSD